MTWPLASQWLDNEELNAAKMNTRIDQKLNLLAASTPQIVPATSPVIAGTYGPYPPIIQSGNYVATTTGTSGLVVFNFSVPFPNFLTTVVVMSGDSVDQVVLTGIIAGTTLSQWAGHVWVDGMIPVAGSFVRLNWIAIGG